VTTENPEANQTYNTKLETEDLCEAKLDQETTGKREPAIRRRHREGRKPCEEQRPPNPSAANNPPVGYCSSYCS